ncbi:MAG: SLBB domain-containing protein [Nitrospiraceae bacterium]|nr:SLBB domain-containing protein [Nitrospiraceae bacterium]
MIYRLGPNDTLRIQVYGEDDLSLETKVEGDGQITYPLLGILHVGGLTIHELQQDLTTRLATGYLSKPKVTGTVARHCNFYVGGEVKTPGGYPYEEGLTVHKAISLAGGFTEKADKRVITITRAHGSQVDILMLEPDAMVRPDDLVAVAQARKFYVNGEVRRAGDYPYERELTLHKAITMAGGFTDKASMSRAKVIRKIEGKEQEISLGLEGIILPEDTIVVPHSFF